MPNSSVEEERGEARHSAVSPTVMPCILHLFTRILRTVGVIWEQEVPGVFEAGAGFDSKIVWARSPANVPRHICPEFCVRDEEGPFLRVLDFAEGPVQPEPARYSLAEAPPRGASLWHGRPTGDSSQGLPERCSRAAAGPTLSVKSPFAGDQFSGESADHYLTRGKRRINRRPCCFRARWR